MEKETKQPLTDEELDQVTGGNRQQNINICNAMLNNDKLKDKLSASEIETIQNFSADQYHNRDAVAGIVKKFFGVDVNFVVRGVTTAKQNGYDKSIGSLIDSIKSFQG